MAQISKLTHQFCPQWVPGDGSCLFWSFRAALGIQDKPSAKKLRRMVVDYILRTPEIAELVPFSGVDGCQNLEKYCQHMRQKHTYAGQPELNALSALYMMVINVVCLRESANQPIQAWINSYGEAKSYPLCIFLQYIESRRHFEPLFICSKSNVTDRVFQFPRGDSTVRDLLESYVQQLTKDPTFKLKDYDTFRHEKEVPWTPDMQVQLNRVCDAVVWLSSRKRKIEDKDEITCSKNVKRELTPTTKNILQAENSVAQNDQSARDQEIKKSYADPNNLENLLQTDFSNLLSSLVPKSEVSSQGIDTSIKDPCVTPQAIQVWRFTIPLPVVTNLEVEECRYRIAIVDEEKKGFDMAHPHLKLALESMHTNTMCYKDAIDIVIDKKATMSASTGKKHPIKVPIMVAKLVSVQSQDFPTSIPVNGYFAITTWCKKHSDNQFWQFSDVQYVLLKFDDQIKNSS